MVKKSPFQTGHRRYADVYNPNSQDTLDNHHWGSTIRKRFLNSNGVSLMIDDRSSPVVFSLNDHEHPGLCIGTRYIFSYFIRLLSIYSFCVEKIYFNTCLCYTLFLIRHSTELSRQHISGSSPKALNYTVCMSKDIKTAHDFLLPQSFWDGHSEKDLKTMQHLLKNPIWQVKTNIFCII